MTLTSYTGCLSVSGGCSVSSGCLVVEARGMQVVLRKSVKFWKRNDWMEQKRPTMMGLWRRSDSRMKHLFAVAASWE